MRGRKCCGNCGQDMEYVKTEQVQMGKTSFLWGDWPNLLAGALNVEIWTCPDCGKIDFYRQDGPVEGEEYEEGRMARTICPDCGAEHDLDDPKCPRCGAKNPEI